MPQPLSSAAPNETFTLGNNTDSPSHQRPELALAAMNVIAEWSILESFVTGLFVSILNEGAKASAAVFATVRSQAGQRDAIRAVVETNLANPDHRDLVLAVLNVYEGASKLRNRAAHWVWGTVPGKPEWALLANPLALATYRAELQDLLNQTASPRPEINKDQILIYKKEDFEEASSKIQRAIDLVSLTTSFILRVQSNRSDDQLYLQLSNEPEIRRELDRLNKDRRTGT